MEPQSTEAITEITQRYELYKDIVKIGLGALIGATASIITIFIKNQHEFKKIEKESTTQNTKLKLEIKVKILEECIESLNIFFNTEYKLRNCLYRLRFTNKFYNELDINIKKEIANTEEYGMAVDNISSIIRKYKMIGAEKIADCLYEYYSLINELREDILMSRKRIVFTDKEWELFNNKYILKKESYDSLLYKFFNQLK